MKHISICFFNENKGNYHQLRERGKRIEERGKRKEERGERREIQTEENLVQETQMGIYFGGKSNLVSPTENNVQTNEFLGKN